MRRPYHHRPYWSKNMERRLVALFHDNPELWDPRVKGNVTRNEKNEILKQIAAKIGKDICAEEVSYKLKYYRDYFNRECRRVLTTKITASSEKDVYKPTWCLFESLKFLDLQLEGQDFDDSTQDDIDENEEAANGIITESEVPMGDHDYHETDTIIVPTNSSFDFQQSSEIDNLGATSPTRPRRSRKRAVPKSEIVEIVDPNNQSDKLVIPLEANSSTALFGNYIGERLASLDDEQKNWAMFKISEVLFKASRREYYMP